MAAIEIPDPVITVEVTHTYVEHRGDMFAWSDFEANVLAGGHVVFKRQYTDNDDCQGNPEYVRELEEAEEKVLAAFAARFKELLA